MDEKLFEPTFLLKTTTNTANFVFKMYLLKNIEELVSMLFIRILPIFQVLLLLSKWYFTTILKLVQPHNLLWTAKYEQS